LRTRLLALIRHAGLPAPQVNAPFGQFVRREITDRSHGLIADITLSLARRGGV
jgi:hypothetical protein